MSDDLNIPLPTHDVVCLACGGRGGWWTGDVREKCSRCAQTGWEPSPTIRAALDGE
jgi:hypothetical protein